MRGHEDLIRMRLSGKAPSIVFINDYPCKTDWFETGDHVTISTSGDDISRIDLRLVTGLRVSITSEVLGRAKALFRLACAAGAKTVAACHLEAGIPAHKQSGWVEVKHG